MAGSNIQSSADQLAKLQEEQLYRSIVNPKPEIESKIRQLRIGYSLNPKQYAAQKRTLPYVVCGIFNPPYRRTENFAFTENFIIDIDHLSDKDYTLAEVRERIQADPRVLMCFASPSADGSRRGPLGSVVGRLTSPTSVPSTGCRPSVVSVSMYILG